MKSPRAFMPRIFTVCRIEQAMSARWCNQGVVKIYAISDYLGNSVVLCTDKPGLLSAHINKALGKPWAYFRNAVGLLVWHEFCIQTDKMLSGLVSL
jgi:hypothetical protein